MIPICCHALPPPPLPIIKPVCEYNYLIFSLHFLCFAFIQKYRKYSRTPVNWQIHLQLSKFFNLFILLHPLYRVTWRARVFQEFKYQRRETGFSVLILVQMRTMMITLPRNCTMVYTVHIEVPHCGGAMHST